MCYVNKIPTFDEFLVQEGLENIPSNWVKASKLLLKKYPEYTGVTYGEFISDIDIGKLIK